MMQRIPKGKHEAWPFRLGLFFKKANLSFLVVFQEDCSYKIDDADQEDTNKLFGLGYLWDLHKESARFGWRYNTATGKILLSAYCYVNGERIIKELKEIELLEPVTLDILITAGGEYHFSVDGKEMATISFTHRKKISYPLNLYFGGNQVAPHYMHVELKRL